MKKYLFFASVLLFLGAGCAPSEKNTVPLSLEIQPEKIVYCSPDGTLIDHQIKQEFKSYCLIPKSSTSFTPGIASTFSFTILDNLGQTVKKFVVAHEQLMHVILVRKDFNEFQHIHPTFDAQTGLFTLSNVVFPTDGEYLLYADFVTELGGESQGTTGAFSVSKTLSVGDATKFSQPNLTVNTFNTLWSTKATEELHTVTLQAFSSTRSVPFERGEQTNLFFLVEKNNKRPGDSKLDAIDPLEPYLGAMGHLVILQEGTNNYIHAHPTDEASTNGVGFSTYFASEGKYKLFFEFKNGGKVRRVEYVVEVKAGAETQVSQDMMMDHSSMGH